MVHTGMVRGPILAAVALLLFAGLIGCEGSRTREGIDDFDTKFFACPDYCVKTFQSEDHDLSDDDTDVCISDCSNSIEDNCGNENQAAANYKTGECFDKNCVEFWACLVLDSNPACLDFASN
jgi:hypothetical protein